MKVVESDDCMTKAASLFEELISCIRKGKMLPCLVEW